MIVEHKCSECACSFTRPSKRGTRPLYCSRRCAKAVENRRANETYRSFDPRELLKVLLQRFQCDERTLGGYIMQLRVIGRDQQ